LAGQPRANPRRVRRPPTIHLRWLSRARSTSGLASLAAEDDPLWAALFGVVLWCGLRKGELLGLQWRDVLFDRTVIQVRQQLQLGRRST
jgi:integrase